MGTRSCRAITANTKGQNDKMHSCFKTVGVLGVMYEPMGVFAHAFLRGFYKEMDVPFASHVFLFCSVCSGLVALSPSVSFSCLFFLGALNFHVFLFARGGKRCVGCGFGGYGVGRRE